MPWVGVRSSTDVLIFTSRDFGDAVGVVGLQMGTLQASTVIAFGVGSPHSLDIFHARFLQNRTLFTAGLSQTPSFVAVFGLEFVYFSLCRLARVTCT